MSPEKTSSFLKRYVLFYLIRQPHSLTALPCVSLPWEQLRKTGDRKRFFWRSPWFPPVYGKYLSGNSLEVELLLHTHLSVWKSTFSGFIQIKIKAFDLKLSFLNSIPCKIHKYLIEQLSLKRYRLRMDARIGFTFVSVFEIRNAWPCIAIKVNFLNRSLNSKWGSVWHRKKTSLTQVFRMNRIQYLQKLPHVWALRNVSMLPHYGCWWLNQNNKKK